jgi:hypothetical protein
MTKTDEEPFDAGIAGGGDLLPRWLLPVYLALLAWGGWYLVHYWGQAAP